MKWNDTSMSLGGTNDELYKVTQQQNEDFFGYIYESMV